MSAPPSILYRYRNNFDVVSLETHHVIRHTPKGFWILPDSYDLRTKRFVLNSGTKRYAFPTKEEAKVSFLARKRRQLRILDAQIQGIHEAILALNENRLNDYRSSAYFFEE